MRNLIQTVDVCTTVYSHTNREGESSCKELPALLLSFTRQVALGMGCLHKKQYIHRDLAARNVMVSEDSVCKVIDAN